MGHQYGANHTFDFNNETASLDKLVADLQKEASDALQALNLTASVAYLLQCNTNFKNKYAQRGDAATEMASVVPMHKLRPQIHANYATFINLIESLQHFNKAQAPAIGNTIDRINQEIKAFNALIDKPEKNPNAAAEQI